VAAIAYHYGCDNRDKLRCSIRPPSITIHTIILRNSRHPAERFFFFFSVERVRGFTRDSQIFQLTGSRAFIVLSNIILLLIIKRHLIDNIGYRSIGDCCLLIGFVEYFEIILIIIMNYHC